MKTIERISKYLNGIACAICFLLMLIICTDISTRTIGKPLPGTIEIVTVTMVALVFLGLAQTHITGGHIAVGFIVDRFGKRAQAIIDSVVYFLSLIFVVLMVWQGSVQFLISLKTHEVISALHFPKAPIRVLVPIGSLFLALTMGATVYNSIRRAIKV